jgi:hypothetical protein
MNFDKLMRLIFILLLLFLTAMIIVGVSSCKILKTKSELKADSTALHQKTKTDSAAINTGAVKKEETKSKEENEWWRIIQQFANKKDTNITNTNLYPSTIIYEGGKGKKEESRSSYDSSFYNFVLKMISDSLSSISTRVEQSSKSKETQAITIWHIIGACIGTALLMIILSKLKISLR